MKRYTKAGILILTLVIPALFFLFLKYMGQNHYTIPRFIPLIDSSTNSVVMKKRLKVGSSEAVMDTVFRTIPAFSLIDQYSNTFTNKNVKDKIYVANFIFTRCGLICPKLTSQMARVQDSFLGMDDVLLVSHSVDPKFDTPAVLKKYSKEKDAIPGKWFFLTGPKKEIYQLAMKGYFVPISDASDYDKLIKSPDETFIHTERLILIDKDGVIRGFYDGTDAKEVDRLIVEIKILRDIYAKQK
jgi:protein SCO1